MIRSCYPVIRYGIAVGVLKYERRLATTKIEDMKRDVTLNDPQSTQTRQGVP